MAPEDKKLSYVVREAILDYQKKNKHAQASLQVVADKVGASYSTVRNIMQDRAAISFKMAKNILSRLNPHLTTAQLLKALSTGEQERLQRFYSQNLETELLGESLEEYFEDERFFDVLFRAFSKRGVWRAEIKEQLGQQGLLRADELIRVGLIKDNDGLLKGNAKKAINLTPKVNQRIAEYALKRYNTQAPFESWLSVSAQSYNEAGYKQIKKILRQAFKEISQVEAREDGKFRAFASLLLINLDEQIRTDDLDNNYNNGKKERLNRERIIAERLQ